MSAPKRGTAARHKRRPTGLCESGARRNASIP